MNQWRDLFKLNCYYSYSVRKMTLNLTWPLGSKRMFIANLYLGDPTRARSASSSGRIRSAEAFLLPSLPPSSVSNLPFICLVLFARPKHGTLPTCAEGKQREAMTAQHDEGISFVRPPILQPVSDSPITQSRGSSPCEPTTQGVTRGRRRCTRAGGLPRDGRPIFWVLLS